MMHHLPLFRSTMLAAVVLLFTVVRAQQIDISLHPTAVPDSFEVRLASTQGVFNGLPHAVFTVRWERTAGGLMNNSDLRAGCGGYTFSGNGTGVMEIADHRYFTFLIYSDRPFDMDCAITPNGLAIGGFRIRELQGCRQVELVNGPFAQLNNLSYYYSDWGQPLTGVITSGPLASGECPPCVPPQITDISTSGLPPCTATGPLDLSVTATGQPVEYVWHAPSGQLFHYLPSFHTEQGVTGIYTVIVSNACGRDTSTVQVEDTLGLGACHPPVITALSILDGPICLGDTLHLDAIVSSDGPCTTYEWEGLHVVQSGTSATTAPGGDLWYTLLVTNACGSATATTGSVVTAPGNASAFVCIPTTPVNLDSLAFIDIMPGHWFFDTEPHSHYFDPATDPSGIYTFFTDQGCLLLTMDLHTVTAQNAGQDTAIMVCSADAPFLLFDLLGPDADTGGIWFQVFAELDGVYHPGISDSGAYFYSVGDPSSCGDMAQVTITEEQAQPWYADPDGDGFGDPSDSLLSCEPVEDRVLDGSDTCPGVPGRVGDPCDDGLAQTTNDVLQDDCTCAGELNTAVREGATRPTVLWPNPNQGDGFWLQLPPHTGPAQLTLTDAAGRVILRTSVPTQDTPCEIVLDRPLATGTYALQVVTTARSSTLRLVVHR